MRPNILDTDSYKLSHYRQDPPGTTSAFAYFESRGGEYRDTLFFGLQGLLKTIAGRFVTSADITAAARLAEAHGLPFPVDGWRRIAHLGGGHLPIRIRAVPEGMIVPCHNALFTVESTGYDVPWIVGWLETMLVRMWYPITVATRSLACKRVIYEALVRSADDPLGELLFKLHDFGARGVSSCESAGIGGAAHLVNFKGTDTLAALIYAKEAYGHEGEVCGFSIPAMEHSTVTAWGRDGEAAAFGHMIATHPEFAMLACVSDSYDIEHAVENLWGDALLDIVKTSGKTIVIRPDSGDPVDVNLRVLQLLEQRVGMQANTKGYKVLPPFYRIIQGDGNDNELSIARVLNALMHAGYSASNIAFGMGGGLLQKLDRDTLRCAFKRSSMVVDGVERDVMKAPKTDTTKASKAGRLDVVPTTDGGFQTVRLVSGQVAAPNSVMRTVFENGELLIDESFDTIRDRAGRLFR